MSRRIPAVPLALLLSLPAAACAASDSGEDEPRLDEARSTWLTADPFEVSDEFRDRMDEVQAACRCFGSLTPWFVIPVSPAADVFASYSVFEVIVGPDIQLPWAAAGAVNPLALDNLLGSSAGFIDEIAAVADPDGGAFELGAFSWSHPTAPDFCSGETVFEMYFPGTGVLFAFRFDSSRDC